MIIALYGRLIHAADADFIKQLCNYLAEKKVEVWVHQPYLDELRKNINCTKPYKTYL